MTYALQPPLYEAEKAGQRKGIIETKRKIISDMIKKGHQPDVILSIVKLNSQEDEACLIQLPGLRPSLEGIKQAAGNERGSRQLFCLKPADF